ncbi:MAG: hypothetical protein LBT20_01600 [Clostridiales bacterium]|jgi:uncharacterized membrane protein YvbJ|nr:hypothetical protein [Clostridiales bacterium]
MPLPDDSNFCDCCGKNVEEGLSDLSKETDNIEDSVSEENISLESEEEIAPIIPRPRNTNFFSLEETKSSTVKQEQKGAVSTKMVVAIVLFVVQIFILVGGIANGTFSVSGIAVLIGYFLPAIIAVILIVLDLKAK